jgi:hypothetical protein
MHVDDTGTRAHEPESDDEPGWGHFKWGDETDWLPAAADRTADSASDGDDD